MENKISIFLMTEKGWSCLKAIIQNGHKSLIDLVIIGQDKNISKDYSEEILQICQANQIPYKYRKELTSIPSKYLIAISWRWLIPIENDSRLIVFHDSLLPKYRGFAPLVNQLIHKEPYIGVTALFATQNYDEGPIIAQRKIAINYPIKIQKAIEKVSKLYEALLVSILEKINTGTALSAQIQDHSKATYSLWRNKQDYYINWNWNALKIKLFIDALGFPYEGAKCYLDAKSVIIQEANIFPDVKIMNRDIGKLIFIRDNKPIIVCGQGLLKIEKAIYEDNQKSIFPLKKFRLKFH